jgi:hypothetical protein
MCLRAKLAALTDEFNYTKTRIKKYQEIESERDKLGDEIMKIQNEVDDIKDDLFKKNRVM